MNTRRPVTAANSRATQEAPVMLFDGKCVFCNGAVHFALAHEQSPRLKFAALQSDAGLRLSKLHGLPTTDFRTFVIVRDGRAYTRYEAAIQLGYLIGGRWERLARIMDAPGNSRGLGY